ncbi:MAG: hypothetical protein AUK47_01105 [Deltaproteobacteria bacterium CG2_30_63_29]|nr:MAG: hypothetical protein AUK47_01105 [Deltaproteobacteria bacterium CG2_30_63_29]
MAQALLIALTCMSCGHHVAVAGSEAVKTPFGLDQLFVPSGEFLMGLDAAQIEKSREICDIDRKTCPWRLFDNEAPQRKVLLSAFYIDKYEATVSQYQSCVEAKICEVPATSTYCTWKLEAADTHPINCVTWAQAKTYCEWAGKRLPTEAEWERAARGVDGRLFPWGDLHPSQMNEKVGNFSGTTGKATNRMWNQVKDYDDGIVATSPVGSFREGFSPVGAADMAGNVAEWVEDHYAGYDETDLLDPTGDLDGVGRVARGGSFSDDSVEIRTTARRAGAAQAPYNVLGFRCAQSADQTTSNAD